MNSALKGIVAGVMMAGISTVLTFLGSIHQILYYGLLVPLSVLQWKDSSFRNYFYNC